MPSSHRPLQPGPPIPATAPDSEGAAPDWEAVAELLRMLAETRAVFPMTGSNVNWISAYEPARRLMLETGTGSGWVQIEHIRECWATFERLGHIARRDVLEPGRRSAFMMALFRQLDGVRSASDGDLYLANASERPASRRD